MHEQSVGSLIFSEMLMLGSAGTLKFCRTFATGLAKRLTSSRGGLGNFWTMLLISSMCSVAIQTSPVTFHWRTASTKDEVVLANASAKSSAPRCNPDRFQ